jgi:biopolymer transport protein ExbD
MPIFVPGKRNRHGKKVSGKRNAVAVLQLTAMVDMFTVLTVFLLQNYATTNQILPIEESVALPDATTVKELKPSNVVIISPDGVRINNTNVATLDQVRNAEDWMIKGLADKVVEVIKEGEEKKKSLGSQIRQAVTEVKGEDGKPKVEVDDFRKITIQADKEMDFLTVKKIMFTVTDAGIYEINFAVIKKSEGATAAN